MDVPRRGEMRREASEMGRLYLLVVLLVLLGAIFMHLEPRSRAVPPAPAPAPTQGFILR